MHHFISELVILQVALSSNNKSQCLLTAYNVLCTRLRGLHASHHLILTINLWGWHCYSLHFTSKKLSQRRQNQTETWYEYDYLTPRA